MLSLIMAACGAAAGAVAGVVTTCAAKEKDKQAIKRYEKVNAELINSRDRLQQRYYELSDRSKKQVNELNLKLAESEVEKDALHLAVRLQNELISLMESIDKNPSLEILAEFKKAVVLTNYVLEQLNESLVPVSQEYFSRALIRVDRNHNYQEEELVSFMSVLMNPPQDTVTSLLGEVQNEMFSQRNKEEKDSLDKAINIELNQEDSQKLQNENQSIQIDNARYDFISDIVESTNAAKEVIRAANPLEKRENETTEDYEIRLKHFENEKQLHEQSLLEQEKIKLERIKIQAKLKREERQAKLLEQKQKQEAKLARIKERKQEKEAQRQAKLLEQKQKQEAELARIKERKQEKEAQRQAKLLKQQQKQLATKLN